MPKNKMTMINPYQKGEAIIRGEGTRKIAYIIAPIKMNS